jgi:hypothetical protein
MVSCRVRVQARAWQTPGRTDSQAYLTLQPCHMPSAQCPMSICMQWFSTKAGVKVEWMQRSSVLQRSLARKARTSLSNIKALLLIQWRCFLNILFTWLIHRNLPMGILILLVVSRQCRIIQHLKIPSNISHKAKTNKEKRQCKSRRKQKNYKW